MSGYESDTCGRSYTIRIRYVWTQIFLYPHKKICGYKNLRIRADGALMKRKRGLRRVPPNAHFFITLKFIDEYNTIHNILTNKELK